MADDENDDDNDGDNDGDDYDDDDDDDDAFTSNKHVAPLTGLLSISEASVLRRKVTLNPFHLISILTPNQHWRP